MISIIIYIICPAVFGLLNCLSCSAAKKNSDKIIDIFYNGGNASLLIKKQFWGIVALSIPVLLFLANKPAALKLLTPTFAGNWMYIRGLVLLLSLFLSSKATTIQISKLKKNHVKLKEPVVIVAYFTGRVIFLFLYELFFRGVLLFSLIAVTGNVISIIINVALYTSLHAYCTTKEIIATVPFGIVICLLCIKSNSVWPAILLHLVVAITTECIIVLSTKKTFKLSIV